MSSTGRSVQHSGRRPQRAVALAAAIGLGLLGGAAAAAPAYAGSAPQTRFANCTALNKVYRHGVGKVGARDKTASKRPVRTFKVSTSLYSAIIKNNRSLDRDRDGIACEKL